MFQGETPAGSRPGTVWCREQDSNLHALRHWILSPARLPIPPSRRAQEMGKIISIEGSGTFAHVVASVAILAYLAQAALPVALGHGNDDSAFNLRDTEVSAEMEEVERADRS